MGLEDPPWPLLTLDQGEVGVLDLAPVFRYALPAKRGPLTLGLRGPVVAAFTLAAVLALLALVTLALKTLLEWRYADQLAATHRH